MAVTVAKKMEQFTANNTEDHERRQQGAVAPLDFQTWYKYSR